MTPLECPREREVVAAVLAGHWPEACDEALRRHAAGCAVCGEVAMVAGLLREDRDTAGVQARLPAAGQVWWRAAVRARLEAAHAAARPLTWLHGLTGASAAGLACAAAGTAWPSLAQGAGWVIEQTLALDPEARRMIGLVADAARHALPFAVAVAVGLVLAPLALFFALSDE